MCSMLSKWTWDSDGFITHKEKLVTKEVQSFMQAAPTQEPS